jgi:hypothetical protein
MAKSSKNTHSTDQDVPSVSVSLKRLEEEATILGAFLSRLPYEMKIEIRSILSSIKTFIRKAIKSAKDLIDVPEEIWREASGKSDLLLLFHQ